MNRNQRDRNRHMARMLQMTIGTTRECGHCGQQTFTGHFLPPSFGEPGLWTCVGRNLSVKSHDELVVMLEGDEA